MSGPVSPSRYESVTIGYSRQDKGPESQEMVPDSSGSRYSSGSVLSSIDAGGRREKAKEKTYNPEAKLSLTLWLQILQGL